MRVVIVGNPFGLERAVFERAVTDAMQGRNLGQPTNFTTTPDSSAHKNYRVVMIFNPPTDLTGTQACQPDPPVVSPRATGGGRLDVFAVFCHTTEVMTQLAAAVPAAAGPNDPMFVELVGQTTRALFAQRSRSATAASNRLHAAPGKSGSRDNEIVPEGTFVASRDN